MACESLASSHVMNGGDGEYSYTRNSSLQVLINQGIAEKLELQQIISSSSSSSTKTFVIADLGCSVGPNTFIAMQNIMEAVKLKWESSSSCINPKDEHAPLEFQVFFNDHVSNDFNQLFQSLPPNNRSFAAGVPGSFYTQLFPEASIHFGFCISAPNEVVEAYLGQFAKDMESFLNARAREIVCGGLMALYIPCRPEGSPDNCHSLSPTHLFGTILMDMAQMGLVSEAKIDSFNLPHYFPTSREMEALMRRNTCFTIENFELLVPSVERLSDSDIPVWVSHCRAGYEGLFRDHFGDDIIEQLFDMFSKKMEQTFKGFDRSNSKPVVECFILLKRNRA
ncbi:hypothetical protein JRO89_XS09G0234800 [Xanthoceras sorbifolium]|uniref:Uncharacterized protein n=1 Tax=Xanthoceras sorbifolium TaxID=99658 RepID=A0ABQ8HMN6_9ROSI|nr:hypothetical protein JRO89_XS09G0234800 [Xanthoceras sorbifolium]